ncbi:unnamed protein product [Symbiodinium sp. CCMP2592]|nr:unnamed protein product [Symbiodinium sp. CCMP2592]
MRPSMNLRTAKCHLMSVQTESSSSNRRKLLLRLSWSSSHLTPVWTGPRRAGKVKALTALLSSLTLLSSPLPLLTQSCTGPARHVHHPSAGSASGLWGTADFAADSALALAPLTLFSSEPRRAMLRALKRESITFATSRWSELRALGRRCAVLAPTLAQFQQDLP